MSVVVTKLSDKFDTYENGDSWVINYEFDILEILKRNSDGTTTTLASYSSSNWSSVKRSPKEDRQQLFEEAVNLIQDVDEGNFGHQSTEWQDRAEKFLGTIP